jgi:hypothetical protein
MTKTLLFGPIQMEELVKRYVIARERRAQLLTCGKVNHVAYKDMERQLLTTMKKLDLHHVHDSRNRCTVNSSVADKALRVYPWRTSRLVEDSLDITLAQNIDTFLALRREKHAIQTQREECDKLLASISEQLCDLAGVMTTLPVPEMHIVVKMIPADRRVLVSKV